MYLKRGISSVLDSANLQNLVKNNPSLRADSQNLRGNPPCERFAESSVDSATPSPLSLDSFSQKGCTPYPLPPTIFKRISQKLPLFAFRGRASLSPLLAKNRRLHFCNLESDFLHHEAGEIKGASHNSFLDSAESQNLVKNQVKKSLSKFLLRFAFAKSRVPPNFIDSNLSHKVDSQNLQSRLPRRFCESARNDEYFLNTAFFAESISDLRGSILEIKSEFCETSDEDRTLVHRGSELKRAWRQPLAHTCKSPILAQKTNAQ